MKKLLQAVFLLSTCVLLTACGGGGGSLSNSDPGNNDVGVVAAFGDSITQGAQCPCTPYPARLGPMIGKSVPNYGIGGSRAADNIGRTQSVIDQSHPGFMIILYGVNDIIHAQGIGGIVAALDQMVDICKANHVVPILATYPRPITGHAIFGPRTHALNEQIRSLASSKGVPCVNLEGEFNADPDLYMADGLHPNDAGTQIVALAFADLF
ncbi:MAG: SGNH/GDSL hydrolase family protein [Kiritimatiellae bacterium]|nr:SGNH/GDSL hydrolase family protein [Kiritimatiellia bacterium]